MKKKIKHKKKSPAPSRRVVKGNGYDQPVLNPPPAKPEPTEADKLIEGKRPEIIRFGSREYIMGIIGLDGLEKVVMKVYNQAIKGSFKHQELLMNYLMGKPVEKLKLDAYVDKGMTRPVSTVYQIIAEPTRLGKLHADAEIVVDHGQIKEMEDLLNNSQLGEDGNTTDTNDNDI